ncbi:MAG: Hpt domain-containing protein [Cystobacterineae bacterium]|nr:Hpt domain-containing protein [Cystobacterineae bacterium]
MVMPGASVNWDDLKSNCGEDEDLMRELIHIFLSESPQMLEDIRRSWKEKDAAALKRTAHRLKGSLVSLAANPAAQCASVLEQMGYEVKLEGADQVMAELESKMSELSAELRRMTQSHS